MFILVINCVVCFLSTVQSYDDSKQFPRNFFDSSQSCMDNRLTFGQIGEFAAKIVQKW